MSGTERLKVNETFVNPHCRLTESPIYDSRNGVLAFVDIIGRTVHWYDYHAADVAGSHKWVRTDSCVGVLQLTQTPMKYAAGVELGFAVIDLQNARGEGELVSVQYLHQVQTESDKLRFNDGAIDPAGRFIAGSMFTFGENEESRGKLYRLESDKCDVLVENVGVPNGVGFSPDNRTMYQVDSLIQTVFAWDYDVETGNMDNRREFFTEATEGVDPDGLCVSEDGSVWVAMWMNNTVRRFSPEGKLTLEIEFPAKRVSCPTFAGKDLNELVVTCASLHLDDPDYQWQPEEDKGGELCRIKLDGVKGIDRTCFPIT